MQNVDNYFEQAGAGTDNKLVVGGSFETAAAQSLKKVFLSVDMTDISTASTVYLPSLVAGTITSIKIVVNGAITVADAVITSSISSVGITNGVVTIDQATAVAGSVFSATPTAINDVTVGDNISFATNGGSTDAVRATIVVEISLS